jgi:micrococcal nuclease
MAATRLKQLLPKGQTVSLREVDRDHYGRTVAEVFVGGRSVNLQMGADGMAAVYLQYVKNCDSRLFSPRQKSSWGSG